MRAVYLAPFFLLLPSVAFAGHVESAILREGSPMTWWSRNKRQILSQMDQEAPTLKSLLGPGRRQARIQYGSWLVYEVSRATPGERRAIWGSDRIWRADLANFQRKTSSLYRLSFPRSKSLGAPQFMFKMRRFLAQGNSTRYKRLSAFAELPRVEEAIVKNIQRRSGVDPTQVIVDLVLLLEFLRPENKRFFLNGYTNDQLNKGPSYGGLYKKVRWNRRSIELLRKEARQVLAELGPHAVPIMERVLDELAKHGRNGGKSVTLPSTSLAVQSRWSTKSIRFPVETHRNFKKEIKVLIKNAKGIPIKSVPPEKAAAVYRAHHAALQAHSGVVDVLVDQDEQTSFILIIVRSEAAKKRFAAIRGRSLRGVPLRFLVQ